MRQERVGQKDDLLLGFPRVHRVDGEQIRCEFARFRFARFTDRDAGVGAGERLVEFRCDLDDLPPVGTQEARVGRQQTLHQSGSAAHHPDDDDRGGDLFVEDFRVAPDPLLCAKPHPQAVHDPGPQDVGADGVEVGARVVGQQHL